METFFVILFFIVVAALELPKKIKNKEYKEFALYVALYIVSLVWGILLSLDIRVPNYGSLINNVFDTISGKK